MKAIILLLLLFCATLLSAQGQTALEFTQTDCKEDVVEPFGYPEKIIKREVKNGRLTLVVTMADNCCASLSGGYTFSENTLKLTYTASEEADPCFCACAFQLRYSLPAPPGKEYQVTLNGRPLKP
ncbi:hypothetical protein [Cesiribacter andamanensis]|uniref:Uncharacterized protein n=1 Tax=Cesiribacter andamanensis AMV16 TaxID=1279009 RepID=M7NC34_9BACT|nr:hypothetical protein [Cesiribacter andamanensis]EMR04782.1 hypothetical protein ADICEAN_00053 [Cesiribacter andamanensis AMV16]